MSLNLSLDDEWKRFLSAQSQPAFAVSCGSSKMIPTHTQNTQRAKTPKVSVSASASGENVSAAKAKCAESLFPMSSSGLFPKLKEIPCLEETFSYDGGMHKSAEASISRQTSCEDIRVRTAECDIGECSGLNERDADEIDQTETETAGKLAAEINTLFISTKTKVLFLNQEININEIFWNIPIEEYWKPVECVVKKQMKIVSKTPEEYDMFMEKLKQVPYYTENVIKQINNPTARRIKFKDERKITIGISKKDIMNCRGKVKNAFYNCFAIIIRFKYNGVFREIHVKIFNTGKLEIPGILNAEILDIMRSFILKVLQPHVSTPLAFVENSQEDNVLINSNFNCGFYIDREKLFAILRSDKYGLETAYDPCIYPGIKCKYYFNNEHGFDPAIQTGRVHLADRTMKMSELGNNRKYTEVSFMIFRTGSCLIVGNCSESILQFIFEFIKNILIAERPAVAVANTDVLPKPKQPKLRKKTISISTKYLTAISL
jgi:hypothetical protein